MIMLGASLTMETVYIFLLTAQNTYLQQFADDAADSAVVFACAVG
mgnify:CR=1